MKKCCKDGVNIKKGEKDKNMRNNNTDFHRETEGFYKHYWLSLVWIFVALAVLFSLVLLVAVAQLYPDPDVSPPPTWLAPFMIGPFFLALGFAAIRFIPVLLRWLSPNKDKGEFTPGCIGMSVTIFFHFLLWPFMEIYNQLKFLGKARKLWRRGEIIIDVETKKSIRAGGPVLRFEEESK